MSMSTWVSMARGSRGTAAAVYFPVLREISMRPLETIKEMDASNVGFGQEQKLNFDDILSDVRQALDDLREHTGTNRALLKDLDSVDERLDEISRILTVTKFVGRYREKCSAVQQVD
jgi:hypothetical protein